MVLFELFKFHRLLLLFFSPFFFLYSPLFILCSSGWMEGGWERGAHAGVGEVQKLTVEFAQNRSGQAVMLDYVCHGVLADHRRVRHRLSVRADFDWLRQIQLNCCRTVCRACRTVRQSCKSFGWTLLFYLDLR